MVFWVAILCGISCLSGALFTMMVLKQFKKVSIEEEYEELQERVRTMEEMFKDRPCLLHRPESPIRIVTEKPVENPIES
jgi:hypothetical protein